MDLSQPLCSVHVGNAATQNADVNTFLSWPILPEIVHIISALYYEFSF